LESNIREVSIAEIETDLRRHLANLPSAIDSFLEEHIFVSRHYRMEVAGEPAGFASIHGGSLITQFSVGAEHLRHGQALFTRLRRMEHVTSAFVPTCDELFLSHALDDYREIAKQAYFFAEGTEAHFQSETFMRPAVASDAGLISETSGEFFHAVDESIASGKLFVTVRNDEPVGFGIIEPSRLYGDAASIGMFTIEWHRNQGVGADTITLLRQECHRRALRPIAGCWYYNHASKRTLEHAGMVTRTTLLRIEF
jgi:RimJ/RimL family protein N-acetyltransferase